MESRKESNDLGLTGASSILYKKYIEALQIGHIRLIDREDELVWKKDPSGVYTPKLGYIALNLDLFQQQQSWWWKGLWKLKCPQKSKLFLWATLNGKIPTWDILQKRQFEGPGRCSLCHSENETIYHLFITFPFTQRVWMEVSANIRQTCSWEGPSLEQAWKDWLHDPRYRELKALPPILIWGIWLARNTTLFLDKASVPEKTVAQSLSILSHFPQTKKGPSIQSFSPEQIDKSKPWDYFDGASQNQLCGVVSYYIFLKLTPFTQNWGWDRVQTTMQSF
jgi:hypothetical protein